MLRELRLRNIAVIEEATLSPGEGLTVLTGETGAGKSIVVDALELVLGGRGSSDLIRSGCEDASVEAVFSIAPGSPALARLGEMDIEASDELIVRRIISSSGRNRAYINGTLVNISTLAEITGRLVDIHGQHEHQSLLSADVQRELLDAFAGIKGDVAAFATKYQGYAETRTRLSRLKESEQDRLQQKDYLAFQIEEISSAGLTPGEDTALEEEQRLLANAERLGLLAEEAYGALYEGDAESGASILKGLKKVAASLETLAEFDSNLKDASESARSCMVIAEEVALAVRGCRDRIQLDPERLETVMGRLDLIRKLKKKYGETLEAILECLANAERELAQIDTSSAEIAQLEAEIAAQEATLLKDAERLSQKRREAAATLEQRVITELADLSMAHARFEVAFAAIEAEEKARRLTATGLDRIEFLIAPNPGESLKPLSKIASGGEISRSMLAFKAILSGDDAVPTLIFDEVDAGIGGRVADTVGEKLKAISEKHQVICVTHLAQVAGYAAHHFHISKKVADGRTFTSVRQLNAAERVEEIARMLGGKEETALRHAGEMLARG
ncbi:MAG: DNA repair protein RecN [Nitrospirota bacterium]|nr:DNA repair protein RecN [Nitrospirota bacterium]